VELVIRRGGVDERLRVERRGERFVVIVGEGGSERVHEVDRAVLRTHLASLLLDGLQFDVTVRPLAEGRYQVGWDGQSEVLEVADPLTHLARVSRGADAGKGRQQITAYMPGRVVEVRVAEGQEIRAGEPLLVLEAMKMQNEIQAERDGTVRKLHVAAGDAVDGGDLLLEIE
jgi:biotin carboxyl carrier protein